MGISLSKIAYEFYYNLIRGGLVRTPLSIFKFDKNNTNSSIEKTAPALR
jgi:hypothetical protein